MIDENHLHQKICDAMFQVLELCHQQGVTTTWRDIFLFLRFPESTWSSDVDLDEKIIVNSLADLEIARAMISSYFATKH